MASSNKILSGPKAKEKIKNYLKAVDAGYKDLVRDGAQNRGQLSNVQAQKVALYDGLVPEDVQVLVEDDYLLAEWTRLHVEYAQAQLRTILRQLDVGPEVSNKLRSHRNHLLNAMQRIDQTVPLPIPDEQLEKIAKGIKHVLNEIPGLAASVLDDLPAELRVRFEERCKEIRTAIDLVAQRAKAEALSELEQRRLSPAEWQILVEQLEIIEIPKIAQTRKQDFDELEGQLETAKAENQFLNSELALATEINQGEAFGHRIDMATLQRELDDEKAKTTQAEKNLQDFRQQANEHLEKQLEEQREDSRKEVDAVCQQLEDALKGKNDAESQLRTANSENESAQALAEQQHTHQINSIREDYEAKLAAANENAVQGVQTVQKSSAELLAKVQQEKAETEEKLREVKSSLITAEANSTSINNQLTNEKKTRVKAEADVIRLVNESSEEARGRRKAEKAQEQEKINAQAAHDQAEKVIEELQTALNDAKVELDKSRVEAEVLKKAISDRLKAEVDLGAQMRISSYAKQALDNNVEAATKRYESHRAALRTQADLLGAEQDAHKKTKEALKEQQRKLDAQILKAKQDKETLESSISKLNIVANAYRDDGAQERTAQAQAVNALTDFMSGVSLIKAPRAEQLRSLHESCKESSSSSSLPALPVIVVASGQLPAAWSYLCFASRGVLMNSRFNEAITSAAAFDLPWVLDTLDRVVKAVVASDESVPVVVLIVLLQGIAYVHLAMKLASDEITWSPKPRDLLEALIVLLPNNPESVLGSVHKRVYDLVTYEVQFNSWILMDEFKGERLDSSNSALPEGVVMIPEDTKDQVFMIRSTNDGEQLFIIDERAIVMKATKIPNVIIWLPLIDGLDLRQMALMNDEHWREPGRWAQRLQDHSR